MQMIWIVMGILWKEKNLNWRGVKMKRESVNLFFKILSMKCWKISSEMLQNG